MNDNSIKDPIVQSVVDSFSQRSRIGVAKYGTTLADNPDSTLAFLQHLQEELMDATLYIEKLKSTRIVNVNVRESELEISINGSPILSADTDKFNPAFIAAMKEILNYLGCEVVVKYVE
jgi:hypothetical protein